MTSHSLDVPLSKRKKRSFKEITGKSVKHNIVIHGGGHVTGNSLFKLFSTIFYYKLKFSTVLTTFISEAQRRKSTIPKERAYIRTVGQKGVLHMELTF